MKTTSTGVVEDAVPAAPPAEVKVPRRKKLSLKEAVSLNKKVHIRTVIIHGKDGKYENNAEPSYSLHSPPAGVPVDPLEIEYHRRMIHFVDQGLNYFGTIMYEGEVLQQACDELRKWGLILIYRTFASGKNGIDCSMTIGGCKGADDVLTIVKESKEEKRTKPGMCWYMQMARMVLFAWNEEAFVAALTEKARTSKKKIPTSPLEPSLKEVPDLDKIKFRTRNAFSDANYGNSWELRGKQYAIAGTTTTLPHNPSSV